MRMLIQYLCVGGAGFLGAISRLLVGRVCGRWFATGFPVGTLVINVTGSFILGWFLAAVARGWTVSDRISTETLRLTIAVGFVGSYTTFSTFMFESDGLIAKGALTQAMLNLVGSLVLGLLAVRFGIWVAER
jgi:CrcB protein